MIRLNLVLIDLSGILHRILPGNTAYELNWNELILMFIPEIMTSIGLLICIVSAN